MKNLGKKIKELRKERGLSQTQFAELIKTTQDNVSLWELNKSLPTIDYVYNICVTFNVSADYLLDLKEY